MSKKKLYKGMKLKGWERNYLKKAEQYGHLGSKPTIKQKKKK